MGRKTLIKGATCVLPGETLRANIVIEDGRIASVDAPASSQVHTTIEARGLHLIPGLIDSHVHFREPGLTHKEDLHTGSLAAARGGVTTFFEMPNTSPTTTTVERLHEKLELAARKSVVNYGFYIGATAENLDELAAAQRTPGIKIFMGSNTGELLVDDQEDLERIFADTSLPICAHCEDESTIQANAQRLDGGRAYPHHTEIHSREAAIIATKRAIDLANQHEHRFHVLHVSTREEAELLGANQRFVTGEACPHHLLFNVEDYPRLGSLVQMNPSVKTADDNQALWAALHDGRLQAVVTDHAPHELNEKLRAYPGSPSGLPAIENSLALMLDQMHKGHCTLEEIVRWMCEGPALVWDVLNKGRIDEGLDADLVLVDLEMTKTVCNEEQITKCEWSPWDGESLTGWPVATWVMGQVVCRDGALDVTKRGREVQFDHALGGYWATASV